MSESPNVDSMLADNVGWGDLICYAGQAPTGLEGYG